MKYKKGGFPFKESALKKADASLTEIARDVATSGTEAKGFGKEGKFSDFAGGLVRNQGQQGGMLTKAVVDKISGGGSGKEGESDIVESIIPS